MSVVKILNYGSMNLDHVYSVPHFVLPGETISASAMKLFSGGKGLNQSIAVAKAGGTIFHAGVVGEDGEILLDALRAVSVNTSYVCKTQGPSSHTIIQVGPDGQNCIIVFSGVNMRMAEETMDEILSDFGPGDLLMLQNELYGSPVMLRKAAARGMTVLLNPSPADEHLKDFPLDRVNWFILNEIEGELLTGEKEPDRILSAFAEKYPDASVVLTIGEKGAFLQTPGIRIHQEAFRVDPVDTTAAGDTFTGYFIAGLSAGLPFDRIMRRSALAASIAVSRLGAADSIPRSAEVDLAEASL